MKNYFQAPLPFQGQKRRFVRQFKIALNGFKCDAVYIDLFGGSGLLAHTVKQHYPEARVIWNDYDDYSRRLEAIPQTNALLAELRPMVANIERKSRIEGFVRQEILATIKRREIEFGYVDFITLSASLMFSGKYATTFEELAKEALYNRIKVSDYDASGYLDGVERVHCDYRDLFEQYKSDSTVFLVDPPYLSTDVSTYHSKDYWKLRDYLDVLNVLDGSNYFYFTSNKSQIVELCEWMETRTSVGNPFSGANIDTTSVKLNHQSGYMDMMLYKYVERSN